MYCLPINNETIALIYKILVYLHHSSLSMKHSTLKKPFMIRGFANRGTYYNCFLYNKTYNKCV